MKILKKTNILFFVKTAIVILNIVVLFFIYSFYKKNVYGSIVVDESYLLEQSKQNSGDINLDKFNSTLEKLSSRQRLRQNSNIDNFFRDK